MPDRPPIASVIGLEPAETVRAFDQRGRRVPTVRWDEMWHEDHARAFTVAKVAKLDLLGEIQASLADVLANGGTFEQWQANIVPYLQAQGWWGAVQDRALTGTDEVVNIGPRRLRTIYDTNLRVSRAAGRWSRIEQLKGERPFLRYTAVLDSRTRPAHRAWHGTVLPVDHPWWDTHFPPCGWFCRCTVRQLSQGDLDRKGWSVTAHPPGGAPMPFTRSTGETVLVPPGISPGFGYNPGKAPAAPVADKLARTLEVAARTDPAAARATLQEVSGSGLIDAALHELAAAAKLDVPEPSPPTTDLSTPERAPTAAAPSVPVAIAGDEVRAFAAVDARVLTISDPAVARQAAELPAAGAEALSDLPATARIVASKGPGNLILADPLRDGWLFVSSHGGAVTSIERLSEGSLDQRLRGATVLRDDTADIAGSLDAMLRPESNRPVITYGRAGAESASDLVGFRRRLGADEIRHSIAKHARDSHPVRAEDFALIPEIIANGRRVDIVGKEHREQIWVQRRGGVDWIVVERVGARRGRLTVRTLFKVGADLPAKYRRGSTLPIALALLAGRLVDDSDQKKDEAQ